MGKLLYTALIYTGIGFDILDEGLTDEEYEFEYFDDFIEEHRAPLDKKPEKVSI